MMKMWEIFVKGIFEQNPIFRLALSLCPALAVTSTVMNAVGMGLAVMFVITANNCVVSVFRKVVNPKVRVPVYITSIATIVTLVQLIMQAFLPVLYGELGIYLALIVVFAIILARAEVFAAKNSLVPSFFDGLGMGVGFALAMLLVGAIRELVGNGSLMGVPIMGAGYDPPLIIIMAPGGFLVIGLLLGIFNIIAKRKDASKASTHNTPVLGSELQRGDA